MEAQSTRPDTTGILRGPTSPLESRDRTASADQRARLLIQTSPPNPSPLRQTSFSITSPWTGARLNHRSPRSAAPSSPTGLYRAQSPSIGDSFGRTDHQLPQKFGDAADYWTCYEDAAERHDKDMITALREDLDVLLIFAGLFSAVNTAFICLSLPNLGPSPDERTTQLLVFIAGALTAEPVPEPVAPLSSRAYDINVNSFLGASLICSLFAAFGAMVSRQWVLHYSRAIAGSPEERARERQTKLDGIKKYRFQWVVEGLPILLQVSFFLFLVGFIEYLLPISSTVSYVAISLSALGVLIFVATIVLGTFDPKCPFQTPVSLFIREYAPRLLFFLPSSASSHSKYRYRIGDHVQIITTVAVQPIALAHSPSRTEPLLPLTQDPKKKKREEAQVAEILYLQRQQEEEDSANTGTACWIIGSSEDKIALTSAARNIPALRRVEGTALAAEGPLFERLLALFKGSITRWENERLNGGPEGQFGPLDEAITYGRALCHLCVLDPDSDIARGTKDIRWPSWIRGTRAGPDSNEFTFIRMCIRRDIPSDFCRMNGAESTPSISSAAIIYLRGILQPWNCQKARFRIRSDPIDQLRLTYRLISTCLADPSLYIRIPINFCAWALADLPVWMLQDPNALEPQDDVKRLDLWRAEASGDTNIYHNIIRAFKMFHIHTGEPRSGDGLRRRLKLPRIAYGEAVKAYETLVIQTTLLLDDVLFRQSLQQKKGRKEVESTLRQILQTLAHQDAILMLKSSSYATQESTIRDFAKRIRDCLKRLRRSGLHSIVSGRPVLPMGEDDTSEPDEVQIILGTNLSMTSPISETLEAGEKKTAKAALSLLSDFVGPFTEVPGKDDRVGQWLRGPEFRQALLAAIANRLNFELISDVVFGMLRQRVWDADPPTEVLSAYYDRALALLATDSALTFRMLEGFLQVWSACHSLGAPFLNSCSPSKAVNTVAGAINTILDSEEHQWIPYFPPSLKEYYDTEVLTLGEGNASCRDYFEEQVTRLQACRGVSKEDKERGIEFRVKTRK